MKLTESQLKQCIPTASNANIKRFLEPINKTLVKYDINTVKRISAFLAQITHESGSLHYVKEIASGKAYEGRKDLGNIIPGDGVKYKGRGIIQITGRDNYMSLSKDFKVDFITKPELLEQPTNAVMSAGWFWDKNKLNLLADVGKFETITRRINGGLNGYKERVLFWTLCKKVLTPKCS